MKKNIKRAVFYFFYLLRIRPNKLWSPRETFLMLVDKPKLIKEYELKKITNFIATINNHKYYNELLKEFVVSPNVPIKDAIFFGRGIGESSLNTFRKVQIEKKILFEKIYFTSSDDLKRIEWFQNNVYGQIKNEIKVPKILRICRGEVLTVVYSEFLELLPFEEQKSESYLIDMPKKLYTESLRIQDFLNSVLPEFVKRFQNHFEYKRGFESAKKVLALHDVEIRKLEHIVNNSRHVLTHGDIQRTNVFKKSILIDWDSFGIFPIGLDPAFLYYRLLVEENTDGQYEEWLLRNFRGVIRENEWIDFCNNFTYFLFVFSRKLFDKDLYKTLEQNLISKLLKSNI